MVDCIDDGSGHLLRLVRRLTIIPDRPARHIELVITRREYLRVAISL